MITPATASTGTTALTPMSGVSAAVRITPVPKPPMPPMIAAASARAPTAASVGASSSKLGARHGTRTAAAVDGDVGKRRLRDLYDMGIVRPSLGEHFDGHGDRSGADAFHVGIEGEQVAD